MNTNIMLCPSCSHKISKYARSCPNCGHPIGVNSNYASSVVCAIVFPFFGVIINLFLRPDRRAAYVTIIVLAVFVTIFGFNTGFRTGHYIMYGILWLASIIAAAMKPN